MMVHSLDSIMGHEKLVWTKPRGIWWDWYSRGSRSMKEGDIIEAWMKNSEGEIVSKLKAECRI